MKLKTTVCAHTLSQHTCIKKNNFSPPPPHYWQLWRIRLLETSYWMQKVKTLNQRPSLRMVYSGSIPSMVRRRPLKQPVLCMKASSCWWVGLDRRFLLRSSLQVFLINFLRLTAGHSPGRRRKDQLDLQVYHTWGPVAAYYQQQRPPGWTRHLWVGTEELVSVLQTLWGRSVRVFLDKLAIKAASRGFVCVKMSLADGLRWLVNVLVDS